MRSRANRILITFGICAFLIACGEVNAPSAGNPSFAKGGNRKTLAGDAGSTAVPDTAVSSNTIDANVPPQTIVQSADAPPLLTYDTTFTAIQGEGNTFVVFYHNPWTADNSQGEWFMKLDVPSDAQFLNADGIPAAYGERVEVTVDIDPVSFFVQFGPHGSVFPGRKPAVLSFNFGYADLGGRDPRDLKVWYQPAVGELWDVQPTTVQANKQKVLIPLEHFSNYAVAWFF